MRIRYKLLFVVLILAMAFMFVEYKKQETQNQKVEELAEKYNDILKKAREEKVTLENELSVLKSNYYLENMGSTIVLLSDTKVDNLDSAIKKLDENNYHGVIALNINYLPDDNIEGYMNRDDINSLLEKGYEVVINAESDDVNRLYNSFIDKGYDIKGFYFSNMSVSKAILRQVKEINSDLVCIGQYDENVKSDDMLIYSYGSKQNGVKSSYSDSFKTSKTIALTVGYENDKELYTDSNFDAMMKLIKGYEKDNSTKLCNISEAIDRFLEYQVALEEQKPEETERMTEINARLDVINDAILGKK